MFLSCVRKIFDQFQDILYHWQVAILLLGKITNKLVKFLTTHNVEAPFVGFEHEEVKIALYLSSCSDLIAEAANDVCITITDSKIYANFRKLQEVFSAPVKISELTR